MITELINLLIKGIVSVIEFFGYSGIFWLMFWESSGLPIPSEIIMPFAGFLVAMGKLNFWLVVLLGALGNLGGSLLAYLIGLKGGRPVIERWGKYFLISRNDLDLADQWFKRYGNLTVFFSRLLPVVRTYISFPAGIAKMDLKKFSFYTLAGALPWSALFTWLGLKMGDNWQLIQKKLHDFDLLILILIIIGAGWYIWRHLKKS
jgi:membrane protein DedA with SNARE-associated domain